MQKGELADCYFFARLFVLTEQPDLIRLIFTEPVENDVGSVGIDFCWVSEQISIIGDSHVGSKNSRPSFLRAFAVAHSG
jgi:hypothetical protein